MKKFFTSLSAILLMATFFLVSYDADCQQIHVNQVGYELQASKRAVVQAPTGNESSYTNFELLNQNDQVVFSGEVSFIGGVDNWSDRLFWTLDFSEFMVPGTYHLSVEGLVSHDFLIAENVLFEQTSFSVVDFFNGMRYTDPGDVSLSFHGDRQGSVDLRGGWFDATGDPGKHMSHLSYANHFNPQQIPMVAWSLMESYEANSFLFSAKASDILDEITFGVDYLMRNLDDSGYFYLAIFDDWGGAPGTREITEWGQDECNSCRSAAYQCAMREGGGIGIASLARAARMGIETAGFDSTDILQAAIRAYDHLKQPDGLYGTRNLRYCNDHEENIIDDYCGLVASMELFKSTNNSSYLSDASSRVQSLLAKSQSEGWFSSDTQGERPFYHAAEEGFPILALTQYMTLADDHDTQIRQVLRNWLSWYMTLSEEVNNPFHYVRQYHKPFESGQLGSARSAFFVPHANETGYWWQGENARLASMTAAIVASAKALNPDVALSPDNDTLALAFSQLDWIMGLNPFDVCMIYGYGEVTFPDYNNGLSFTTNIVGGICNGITADDNDESNIAWAPSPTNDWTNWRWVEQWLPHDAWYLLALSEISQLQDPLQLDPTINITITNPLQGQSYTELQSILVEADVSGGSAISHVEFLVDGIVQDVDVSTPYSGNVILGENGTRSIRVQAYSQEGWAFKEITVDVEASQSPFNGLNLIPGTIEVEDYDLGGEGIAYHDETESNLGGAYRTDAVDIEVVSGDQGRFNIGFSDPGEWLEYTVHIAKSGEYEFAFRVASDDAGGALSVELDGSQVIPLTTIASTGGWQSWQDVIVPNVQLNEGLHVLRINVESGPYNLNYVGVTSLIPDCRGVIGGEFESDTCDRCLLKADPLFNKSCLVTGDTEVQQHAVGVFPNPVSSKMEVSGRSTELSYIMYDPRGSVMLSGVFPSGSGEISVKQLDAGTYFLQIEQSGMISWERVTKY